MDKEETELFAKLLCDNMSLQADVTLLKGFLMDHFEEYYKDTDTPFNPDFFDKVYYKKRRELFEQIFVQFPIISDALARMIRDNLL